MGNRVQTSGCVDASGAQPCAEGRYQRTPCRREISPQEFTPEEYAKKSEQNIVGLVSELNEIDNRSRSRSIGTIAGISLTCLALVFLFVSSLLNGRVFDIVDLPTLVYLLGLKFAILSISGWFHDYLNAWKICLLGKRLSEKEMKVTLRKQMRLALGWRWPKRMV